MSSSPPSPGSASLSLSVRKGVEYFAGHFGFGDSPSTRRTYMTALVTWLESLSSAGVDVDRFSLVDLDSSIVHEFIQWLKRTRKQVTGKNQKSRSILRFRPPTIQLYVTALLRAIRFWREEGLIQFTAAREKGRRQASQIRSKKKNLNSGRAELVDDKFGERMLSAALEIPLPSGNRPLDRLEVLRARALISLLYSTALRISDVVRLTRQDLAKARAGDGILEVSTQKTGQKAHVFVSSETQEIVQEYLDAREDRRPHLLISHGKGRRGSSDILSREKYGDHLSERAGYRIEISVARRAYPRGDPGFVGPHAFRHWHGQRLRSMNVHIDLIQDILGHSSPDVTKKTYAPLPNNEIIKEIEKRLQQPIKSTE